MDIVISERRIQLPVRIGYQTERLPFHVIYCRYHIRCLCWLLPQHNTLYVYRQYTAHSVPYKYNWTRIRCPHNFCLLLLLRIKPSRTVNCSHVSLRREACYWHSNEQACCCAAICMSQMAVLCIGWATVSGLSCVSEVTPVQQDPISTLWRRNYFFLISAHSVYKMWIIQEPNKLALWNKLHFEEKKPEIIEHV